LQLLGSDTFEPFCESRLDFLTRRDSKANIESFLSEARWDESPSAFERRFADVFARRHLECRVVSCGSECTAWNGPSNRSLRRFGDTLPLGEGGAGSDRCRNASSNPRNEGHDGLRVRRGFLGDLELIFELADEHVIETGA
jgi:hypothetical protein